MANLVGTANNFYDLFDKIVEFLTTDSTLVADGQAWQTLRLHKDNLASYTTDFNERYDGNYRFLAETFQYDPRCHNRQAENNQQAVFYDSSSSANRHVTMELRTAKIVDRFRLIASENSTYAGYMPKDFRVEFSDDGVTWTEALQKTGETSWATAEERTFTLTNPPATAKKFWRILIDATNYRSSSARASWKSMLLLEPDDTIANQFGSEVIFKATGNGGSDEIFTGIKATYNPVIGWYNLIMNGYSGFDPNQRSFFKHPGALNSTYNGDPYDCYCPMVPCWNSSIPFWFVASGRSFRFGVKIGTNFEGGYLGFLLPYSTPGQYPYPLAVGGSLTAYTTANNTWVYDYVHQYHSVYPHPGGSGSTSTMTGDYPYATLFIRDPEGAWRWIINMYQSDTVSGQDTNFDGSSFNGSSRACWPHIRNDDWASGSRPFKQCVGGGYMTIPVLVSQFHPTKRIYGELEGTYDVSGFGASAEDTISVGGKTFVMFQNCHRNTPHEHWALSLD